MYLLALLPFANAFAGGEVGNGGQQVALEFTTSGFTVSSELERNFHPQANLCSSGEFQDLCNLDFNALQNVIRLAKITSLPELSQRDEATGLMATYVALNYPQDQRILVSESEWIKPELCYVKKLPIVLHEYLGLLGVEIQNYHYSSLFSLWLMNTSNEDQFKGCPELKPIGEEK